jgi:hypothetical protein
MLCLEPQRLANRCSRRRALVLPALHMTKTVELVATRAPARRG